MAGASRQELLKWVNDLLQSDFTKVEQLGTGWAYCQILDSIFGDVLVNKVKYGAKEEWEYVHNFKIMQMCVTAHKMNKAIPVDKLIKLRFQDNFEFLQWLKVYWDTFYPGGQYDAVGRRRGQAVATMPGGGPVRPGSAGRGPLAVGKRTATPSAGRGTPRIGSTQRAPSVTGHYGVMSNASTDGKLNQKMAELNKQMTELKLNMDSLEKERDFYFDKLRSIEILVQQQLDAALAAQEPEPIFAKEIQAILYSTEPADGTFVQGDEFHPDDLIHDMQHGAAEDDDIY